MKVSIYYITILIAAASAFPFNMQPGDLSMMAFGGGAQSYLGPLSSLLSSMYSNALAREQIHADLLDRHRSRQHTSEESAKDREKAYDDALDARLHEEYLINTTIQHRQFIADLGKDAQRAFIADGVRAREDSHTHVMERMQALWVLELNAALLQKYLNQFPDSSTTSQLQQQMGGYTYYPKFTLGMGTAPQMPYGYTQSQSSFSAPMTAYPNMGATSGPMSAYLNTGSATQQSASVESDQEAVNLTKTTQKK